MTNTPFVSDDYVIPQTKSKYFQESKLEEWKSVKIRILQSPIIWWEDWKEKEWSEYWTPVRTKERKDDLNQVKDKFNIGKFKRSQEFRAMKIWNYNTEQIEIRSTTRNNIKEQILELNKSEDRWSPLWYDLRISKKGKDKDTKYYIQPSNKSAVTPEIFQAELDTPCDLEALFHWADPFESKF